MANIESPIPLSDIESVLAWVDSFKLSRSNKKINRDFSDAVLLAEILSVHYPKLVEMHNYPPRNSHALKLNNWMTLNRKVLRKLKLNLCCNTMEQLANCTPGVIERVLVMEEFDDDLFDNTSVRDKIRRDEEINKSMKEAEQNLSSGGSYYEACGDEEHVLVVPVKTRVNGVLETVQQKVISFESYQALKEENKDAKDSIELLKQKVEHLDNMLKLKDERIDELQMQLDRKQARRKETEAYQNSLGVPFETVPSPIITDIVPPMETNVLSSCAPTVQTIPNVPSRTHSLRSIESATKIQKTEESKIPVLKTDFSRPYSKPSIESVTERAHEYNLRSFSKPSIESVTERAHETNLRSFSKPSIESATERAHESNLGSFSKPSIESVTAIGDESNDVDRIKSDIFKDIEIVDEKLERFTDVEEFKDSEQNVLVTIEDTIQKEVKEIINRMEIIQNCTTKD